MAAMPLIARVEFRETCGGTRALRRSGTRLESELDHLEIGLGHATVRASPCFRHIFPARAGLDAVIRPALGFAVEKSANHTHERAKRCISLGHDHSV